MGDRPENGIFEVFRKYKNMEAFPNQGYAAEKEDWMMEVDFYEIESDEDKGAAWQMLGRYYDMW